MRQPVRVKVAAYQFQKYGMLEGTIRTVSAGSSAPNARRCFRPAGSDGVQALIELPQQSLAVGDLNLPLAAGMQVSAEIVQGKRSVLEYLLSPVQKVVSEAGTER